MINRRGKDYSDFNKRARDFFRLSAGPIRSVTYQLSSAEVIVLIFELSNLA